MKHSYLSSIIGGIVFLLVSTSNYFSFLLIEKFLIFAFFVILPLVLLLLHDENQTPLQQYIHQWLVRLHFPAGLLSLGSLLSSKTWEGTNVLTGSLSLGWLIFTLLLAIYGTLLIIQRKAYLEEIAIGVGLIYFFIGGIWFSLYQYKTTFFHVDPTVSALSSIHFHFSSAIVPIFIGMLGRIMEKKAWYKWLVGIDIIGPILIAFGIIFSKPIEIIGVILFACNIAIYSTYLLLKLKGKLSSNRALFFLKVSSLSFFIIIAISISYPLGKRLFSLTIMDVIPIYGSLHAFGFVLFGLLGWSVRKPTPNHL